MTLEEIVYQIEGSLRTEVDESEVKISLFDSVGKVVTVVRTRDGVQTNAVANGFFISQARYSLACLLRGNTISYYWPAVKGVFFHLRVPETLTH